MPELPEVETVVRQLSKVVANQTIKQVLVYDKKIDPTLERKLLSAKIIQVKRKNKNIVLFLSKGGEQIFLVIHLRMTGRLVFSDKIDINQKNPRLELILTRGGIRFYDLRRFGTAEIFSSWENIPCKGLDPTSKKFTFHSFLELIVDNKQSIKTWLMRQDKLIGIGNIYASEILFAFKISPMKKTKNLSLKQKELLYKNIKGILEKATKNCGTTFSDFQDAHGITGRYQKYLKVYAREGEKCKRCSSYINRFKQGGRSTFYCPQCQK